MKTIGIKRPLWMIVVIMAFIIASAVNSHSMELTEEYWQQAANSISPGMFPVETVYQQTGLGICGTQYTILAANPNIEVPEYFKVLTDRPELVREYDTPEGNFKIHYDPTGTNAPYQAEVDVNPADGHPDFINAIGNFSEYCWSYEIDTLGFNRPPVDNWYPEGGDERYDVYVIDLPDGTFGLTASENSQDGQKATSFIQLDKDYNWVLHLTPFESAAVTMAHEFFHSIQMGYDVFELDASQSPWWYELSAVWMEEQVYDNINDYINYLPYFFDYPDIGLTHGGPNTLHVYASGIWGLYLTERFDAGSNPRIMRQIWERCGAVEGYNAISAMDEVLVSHSSSLNRAFAEFATWNYFTADRADTIHDGISYEEAHTWYIGGNPNRPIQFPDSVMVEMTEFPEVPDTTNPGDEVPSAPEYLAANYIKFRSTGQQGGLKAGFNGKDNATWEVVLMGASEVPSIYAPDIKYFDLDNNDIGFQDIYGWNKYSHVVMVPCVVGDRPYTGDATYRYFAEFDTSLHGDEPVAEVNEVSQNFPNPLRLTGGNDVTYFPIELIEYARPMIKIYTTAGELVRELEPKANGTLPPGIYEHQFVWDGKNDNGKLVASGVYIYHFFTDDQSDVKKMIVIR
ncbi:MAG: hypothetical protein GY855_06050 [candidate division Zixibacteria bacterium]|nr:hypothetical protein [candidate division Zixibacteria bacterium]